MLQLADRPRLRPPDPIPSGTPSAPPRPATTRRSGASSPASTASCGRTRSYGLSRWDVDDVIQTTWLQFIEHRRALREPAAISGWLVTTARRQSLRQLQRHVREQLSDDPDRNAGDRGEPDGELIAAERRELVDAALSALPDRPRHLMRVLVDRPELSYEEVGRVLWMPVGSIGPTRARSLDRLRDSRRLRALYAAGVESRRRGTAPHA